MGVFLLFCLASVGLTQIVVEGEIMEVPREWLRSNLHPKVFKVFECPMCFGFWSGMICGAMLLELNILVILGAGFAGSFLSTFANIFLNYLEARSIVD